MENRLSGSGLDGALGSDSAGDEQEAARGRFVAELWQRFEALQQWAVEHWPDQEHPLSSADFVKARQEILALRGPVAARERLHEQLNKADGGVPATGERREPADGGAQYEEVTPAPWP